MGKLSISLFLFLFFNLSSLLNTTFACDCSDKPPSYPPVPKPKPPPHKPPHFPPKPPKSPPYKPPKSPLLPTSQNRRLLSPPPPPYVPKPPVAKPPPPPPYVPKPPVAKPPPPPSPPPYVPKPPVAKPPPPPVVYPPPYVPVPRPPPPVKPAPVVPSPETPCPPPPPKPATCPIDTLKLGACVDLLGGLIHIGIGGSTKQTCCPVLEGLVDLDAAVCLCTTIRAKLLNINLIVPIALQVLIDCGKHPPSDFQCPAY